MRCSTIGSESSEASVSPASKSASLRSRRATTGLESTPIDPEEPGPKTLQEGTASCDARTMKANTYRRILLATDGTDPAAAATNLTASMAQATEAEVRVLHVWNPGEHQHHVEGRSDATAIVARTLATLQAHGLTATGEIVQADDKPIAAAIAQAARDFEADLVVMGSRGLSDWQSLLAHSVSHQL